MSLTAQSRLVAADQVYRPVANLALHVENVRYGWVSAVMYDGTRRVGMVRIPRDAFLSMFSNYSTQGESP